MYTYKYPRPALTTDSLIFGFDQKEQALKILLIKRKNEPFKDSWAIPGGFVDIDETAEHCAARELKEETCLHLSSLSLLTVASKVDRDPRGRSVSVVFWAIIPIDYSVKAQDDAAQINWFLLNKLPSLAFDHSEILNFAINELIFRAKISSHFQNFFLNINTKYIPFILKRLEQK